MIMTGAVILYFALYLAWMFFFAEWIGDSWTTAIQYSCAYFLLSAEVLMFAVACATGDWVSFLVFTMAAAMLVHIFSDRFN